MSPPICSSSPSHRQVFVFVLIFSELRIPPAQQRSVLYGVCWCARYRALLIVRWTAPAEAGSIGSCNPFAALIIFAAFRLVWGKQKEQRWLVARVRSATHGWPRLIPSPPQYHGQLVCGARLTRWAASLLLASRGVDHHRDHRYRSSRSTLCPRPRDYARSFHCLHLKIFACSAASPTLFWRESSIASATSGRTRAILIFFGARLLLGDVLEVPTVVSLGVIAAGLALSVAAFNQSGLARALVLPHPVDDRDRPMTEPTS